MDADDIENVIEEELDKLSVNLSDMGSDSDTDIEEDFTASVEKLEKDLPDSVLTYFKASSNRLNTVEQLILEDLDDLETMCNEMFSPSQHADLLSELGSNFEDPLKLKERIMSEIEEQVGPPCETHDLNGDYDTEYDTHKDSERQLMFEWRRLEERLRKEEEQRLAELEAEREQCMTSAREEEEKRRHRSEQFEEELMRTEATNQFEYLKAVEGDGEISQSLQLEMVEQQELIKRLEEQIAEERRVFEEVQREEGRRTVARRTAAATKLQAAFRGTLVRHWSKKELTKRREEERRRQEERKEMERRRQREERMKMEWEKERRRVEQEVQRHREEAERRRAEYERAKEQERHRLERERKLEEQRRKKKEEAKSREDERKRKEEKKQKRMEERSVEEEMRKVQEQEEKKIKEEEKAKRFEDEIKRKEDVESPEGMEERRGEEESRKVQEDEENKSKEKEKAKRIEDEIKRKNEEESVEKIEERTVEEVRRKVKEDEEKTRKEEEKAKRLEDDRKRKDEEKQKEMEGRRVEEERKRKEVEESKRIEDERRRKEKEKQKSMEIRRVEEEKWKVQVEEEKERKRVEEAKRAEDERKRKDEEKQKRMEERRVEENKKRKEEEEEKRTDAEIKRKEEEEKQKGMNEKRVVEEIRLKEKEQLKENETEQMQKEQRNKLKEKDNKGEEIVMKRNDDGQNMEKERRRNIIKDNVKGLVDQRENPETDKESENTTNWGKDEKCGDNVSQLCLSHSVNMSRSFLARTLSSRNDQDEQLSSHLVSALPTLPADNSSVTLTPSEEKSATGTGGPQCAPDDSRSACLPDSTEQKRLAWMMSCTPWSKLSMQNKRKGLGAPPRRRGHRRASGHSLLPFPVDTVLRSGPWSSLKQVTSVTLEDLSGCSLSTLSECTRLQSLTLRRCRLQALDGLNQCTELQHIDLQENNITYVDCGGLARLEVLLLGRNQLMSIHGLDDAVNLTMLQLSHNIISRISGLGSLKKLHRLTIDHNQLISTRGLSEAFTLLHLDCSYNHLSHVEGLENCALLNTLDLRGNNLTELPVLKNHVLLRELYLDDNSICSLHGLESCWLPLLHCLSVPQNSITQLPLLVDLVSLKTLNVSHNCLSELRNICMSLQGCTRLQELSINDNPVQQENNWRSSVLAVNPNLIKLNGEQTGASGTLSADSTQLWSFQALCQAHQDQIDSVLQRHSMEISSAPSALHAQLLVGNHATELFQLAEEQRYAHEYGDSGVCETAMQEPVASSHLHELSAWDLAQKKSAEAKTQQPAEHKTLSWQAPHGCPGSCISPTQKFRDTQPRDRYSRYAVQASRMDLKTVAAMVIQCRWREHRQRRRTGYLGPPAKAHSRLNPQREVKSCKTWPERLNKDYAATVIQAVWRGYLLRKRLARALMLAQLSEGDEAFEEVDMDEFIFDEEAMEKDWITLHSDMSPSSVLPYSEQLPLPKPLLPLPELHKSASVQPRTPRQAWISGEETPVLEQRQSPDPSTRMRSPASTLGKYSLSERSEKILEEWGLSSGSTARLMLKRAQRMKARKQQHQKKLLDPAVRLALFRKRNMRPVAMSIHRSRPEFREEIKAGRGDVSVQEALRGEPEQMQMQTRRRTYQWLQTQAVLSQRSSAPSASDHFLPEIDPEILNGGRVQLVASTGYREAPDSAGKQWIDSAGFSSPQNHQAHTRTHSAGPAKKEVPSPQRVTLAPSRKERISFRDNPVQLSGGWGGGKKRSNANKLK